MQATRRLGSFLTPYWRWATLAPLLMVLEVAMDLLQPRLIQRIVDQGILPGNQQVVLSTSAWMIIVAVIGLAGGIGCGVFTMLASMSFGADLRSALFRKVQSLSFGNLDKLETGGLITRLTNDVTQVQDMLSMLLRGGVRMPLLLIGSLILAILTSPQLALIFLVLLPVILAALVWIINRTFPMFTEVQHRLDALNTVMQENLSGVRVVKAFARSAHERMRFSRSNDSLMEQNISAVRTSAITMPFLMLVLNAGIVAAVWLGGMKVAGGSLDVGQLIAFINYLTQALMSLVMVSMLVVRFARAEASAARIHEVLVSAPQIVAPSQPQPVAATSRLVFEHVTFSYAHDGGDPVLKDVSFVAEPGQTVALLGATGAGKSTLVNLIPRFYDVSGGRVTLNGVDVRQIDETALRATVGVALQESVLFSGTIRDNIRYGRPEASDDEVIATAKLAQAHDFVSHFPDGYDTVIGQRGVNLSGGQKQRIAIARALLNRPSVLVLDDSTSAVDVETEARIQEGLLALPERQTRVVVAQRISTVLNADTILVLDDGRVVAEGSHAALLEASPIYQEIYASQLQNGAMIQ